MTESGQTIVLTWSQIVYATTSLLMLGGLYVKIQAIERKLSPEYFVSRNEINLMIQALQAETLRLREDIEELRARE